LIQPYGCIKLWSSASPQVFGGLPHCRGPVAGTIMEYQADLEISDGVA
jgi:hypothetical protein